MKRLNPALLFDRFKQDDLTKTRYYWKTTNQSEPSWLRNLGSWSIGYRTLLG